MLGFVCLFFTLGVIGLDYFHVKCNFVFAVCVWKMNSVQIMLVEKQSYLASNLVLVILLNQSIASDDVKCLLSKVTSVPC